MKETELVSDDGESFRRLAFTLLIMNLLWNIYLAISYLYVINTSCKWGNAHDSGFFAIMMMITLINLVYAATIVKLRKNKFSILWLTSRVLCLDMSYLMYFYYRIITLGLLLSWKNTIYEYETMIGLPIFWQKFIENVSLLLLIAVLLFPLAFKAVSVMVLSSYEEKFNGSSFNRLQHDAGATLHFVPDSLVVLEEAPSRVENTDPPPPYSRYPIIAEVSSLSER